jgi:hypothetical protein
VLLAVGDLDLDRDLEVGQAAAAEAAHTALERGRLLGAVKVTLATTTCPVIGLGSPRTTASVTPCMSSSTLSTSVGYTFSPPTLTTSERRPRKRSHSPSVSTSSPVSSQPPASNGLGWLR